MRSVNVAELRDQLSAFLQLVRAGEEIVVRDRNVPIARILPLHDRIELDERSLVASGQMTLPKRNFDEDRFWSIGRGARRNPNLRRAIRRALEKEREEAYASFLGYQRHPAPLRSRASK